MNMKKKVLLSSLLIMTLLFAAACGADNGANNGGETNGAGNNESAANGENQSSGEVVKIDIATVYEEKAAPSKGAQRLADLLNETGQFEVNFFPNGALGSERENYEAVRAGDLEMVLGGYTAQDMYAPEYMFFYAPFLFQDMEHMKAALFGDLGDQMFEALAEENLQLIGPPQIRGERHITANKPIETPEDVQGLNIRVPEMEALVSMWEALGASPTPVALPELYGALQTGVVDASEGPYEQIATFKLNEVQDYLINAYYIYESTFMFMNGDLWNSLTPEQQDLIQEKAEEAVEYANEEAIKDAEIFYQELIDGGMEPIDPDKEAFIEAAQEGLQQAFETSWTVTTLEEINSLAE